MQLPRMTTQRWMVVVVIVGLSLAAGGLWSRNRRYRHLAESFAGYERHCQAILSGDPQEMEGAQWSWDTDPEWNRRLLSYSTRMRVRFTPELLHQDAREIRICGGTSLDLGPPRSTSEVTRGIAVCLVIHRS
jgi:hypothetical protein